MFPARDEPSPFTFIGHGDFLVILLGKGNHMTTLSTLLAQASDTQSSGDSFLGFILLIGFGWLLYQIFRPRGWTWTGHQELRPH